MLRPTILPCNQAQNFPGVDWVVDHTEEHKVEGILVVDNLAVDNPVDNLVVDNLVVDKRPSDILLVDNLLKQNKKTPIFIRSNKSYKSLTKNIHKIHDFLWKKIHLYLC